MEMRFIDVFPPIREAIELAVNRRSDGDPVSGDDLPAGWRPFPRTDDSGGPVVVCKLPDPDMIESTIMNGDGGVLQAACPACSGYVERQIARLAAGRMVCFSIRSSDLYGSDLANSLTSALATTVTDDADEAELARTVLDELLQNAIVHGNLDLGSQDLRSMEDIDRFNTRIAERLNSPAYGGKHVGVGLWRAPSGWVLGIVDDGNGYDFEEQGAAGAGQQHTNYSGRGAMIVRSLSKAVHVDLGGRRTLVRF
jgi:hypothetical protein